VAFLTAADVGFTAGRVEAGFAALRVVVLLAAALASVALRTTGAFFAAGFTVRVLVRVVERAVMPAAGAAATVRAVRLLPGFFAAVLVFEGTVPPGCGPGLAPGRCDLFATTGRNHYLGLLTRAFNTDPRFFRFYFLAKGTKSGSEAAPEPTNAGSWTGRRPGARHLDQGTAKTGQPQGSSVSS
jgi:hypothetical protein